MKKMRRSDREITNQEKIKKILEDAEYGVLSTADISNIPYGVPVNYVYNDNAIYFHSAHEGHKIENILLNDKVSFCIVGKSNVLEEKFTTTYESVIISGKAMIVQGHDKKISVLKKLIKKYSPGYIDKGFKYIEKAHKNTTLVKIEIQKMTGKSNK